MYGMVLMAALTTADVTPDFGHHRGCCGCHGGCYGCWGGCYGGGCCGCWGGGCWGCYGGGYGGCYGCWGGYSLWSGGYGGCFGCYGGCMGGCMGGCYGGCAGGYGAGIGYDGTGYGVGAGVGVGVGGMGGPYIGPGTGGTGGTGGTDGTDEKLDNPKDGKKKKDKDLGMFPTKAQLVVELPADAKLYIDDQAMKTPAGKRTFNTPKLQPDQTYYYILRAEVERDGKTVSKTRRVLIRAGEVVRASFSDLAPDQSVAQASK